ncbi:unnamed protein product [Protopolystoma xenopodis]|uniref:Uncharacterized protein n=1 Tax=Protopolystoma xenopodis TaxID=117903 RepID=A0A448WWP2_9PLAT|nr:unnamed protein product [Protopolystoma xenopodis]
MTSLLMPASTLMNFISVQRQYTIVPNTWPHHVIYSNQLFLANWTQYLILPLPLPCHHLHRQLKNLLNQGQFGFSSNVQPRLLPWLRAAQQHQETHHPATQV